MNESIKRIFEHQIVLTLFLFLFFLFLTLVFTRPMLSELDSHTVGGYGDNHYFMWIIGWTRQALFDLGQSPHDTFLLNHPFGYQLALTEIAPLQILFALPFALIVNNPVLGYNIAMLMSFVLSGMFMFYWVRRLTASFQSSLIAATAYAFLPYHFAHMLSGHLNLVAIQWFPLYFWGFFEILESKAFSWKSILLLAIGLSGIALSSQYYLFMALFVSLVIFIIALIRKQCKIGMATWNNLFVAGALSLPALLVGTIPYYLVHRGGGTQRPITDVMIYSASLTDYLLPFTRNPITGKWVAENFPRDLWGEATLYLGLPVLLLAVYALAVHRPPKKNHVINHIALAALISFILSLGTNLAWMEQPVLLTTPAWLRGFIQQDAVYVYLPGYLLYKYFPFYDIMRAWMRYGIIVMTMMCALAGVGTAALLHKLKPRIRTPLTLLMLLFVILDFSVRPLSLVEIKPRLVDEWLAAQPPGGQVQLPLAQSFEPQTIYYTLTNQKPLLGQMNTYPSNRYFQLEPVFSQFPDTASVAQLRQEQIKYVLVDEDHLQPASKQSHFLSSLGLDFAGSFDGIAVFCVQ